MQMNGTAKGAPILSIIDAVRRRKFYIIVPAILLTACVAAYTYRLPNRYRAHALLAVETPPGSDLLKPVPAWEKPNIQDQLRVIHETLLAGSLIEEVIGEFKLEEQSVKGDPSHVVEDVKGRIQIEVEGKDAFHIGFEGGDKQQVTDIANRLAELFIRNTSKLKERNTEQAVGVLNEEVQQLRKKLDAQDETIRRYKQGVGEELPDYLATNMKLLETLEARLRAKGDSIAEKQSLRVQIVEEMKGLQNQELQKPNEPAAEQSAAEKKLDELKLQLKEAEAKYKPQHPEIPRLRKQIDDLEQTVAAAPHKSRAETPTGSMRHLALKAELEGIDQRLRSYKQEEREITAQIAGLQQRIAAVPRHQQELAEMKREQESTRSQYLTLLDKQHDVRLAGRLKQTGQGMIFKIAEPARIPLSPYSPQRQRLILLGFIASLGLGVGLAFFMEYQDTAFETLDDFKSFTNLPLLAAIPPVPLKPESRRRPPARGRIHLSAVPPDSAVTGSQLLQPNMRHLQRNRVVTLTDPGAVASEQYSILAVKLRWHLGEGSSKVLSLTSASGGEGKTLTAVNMSIALTESGVGKVLLVDADLRKPRVHDYLGIESGNGLSNLLQDPEGDIHRDIRKLRDLYVLPGGSNFANPVAILGSDRMRHLIERLRLEFRFIVLDSPPILPIADSQVLAGYADGVLIVVRARRTRRELFQHAVESFRAPNIVGVVLNDVNHRNSRYYRAYEYYKQNYYKRRYLTGA